MNRTIHKRGLIIEPDAPLARGMSIALSEVLPRTEVSLSAMEALNLLQTNQYDYIFMEIDYPCYDGVKLLTTITERAIETFIIVMTADFEADALKQFHSENILVMEKPVNINELKLFIRNRELKSNSGR